MITISAQLSYFCAQSAALGQECGPRFLYQYIRSACPCRRGPHVSEADTSRMPTQPPPLQPPVLLLSPSFLLAIAFIRFFHRTGTFVRIFLYFWCVLNIKTYLLLDPIFNRALVSIANKRDTLALQGKSMLIFSWVIFPKLCFCVITWRYCTKYELYRKIFWIDSFVFLNTTINIFHQRKTCDWTPILSFL